MANVYGEQKVSIKEQMQEARRLIQAREYDKARKILVNIDHPTAKQWLARIDQISPPQQAGGSGRLVLIVTTVLIAVVVIVGLVAVLAGGGDDESSEETESEVADDSSDEAESNNEASASDDNDNGEIIGSGERIAFQEGGDVLFMAELPVGWICDCDLGRNRLEPEDSFDSIRVSMLSRAFDYDHYLDLTVDDALVDQVRDDEELLEQETVQANGRDVLIASVREIDEEDEEERDVFLLVQDSDGHILRFFMPEVDEEDQAFYREAALFIAGNIEGEPGDVAREFNEQLLATTYGFDEATNRWRVSDFSSLGGSWEHSLEMPEGWVIEAGVTLIPAAVRNSDATTSATAVVFLSQIFDDAQTTEGASTTIMERFDETITSSETVQAPSGREVVIVNSTDDTGLASTTYLVMDSNRNLIGLIPQPSVTDVAALRDDLIFMAGTVEANEITWEERVERAQNQ